MSHPGTGQCVAVCYSVLNDIGSYNTHNETLWMCETWGGRITTTHHHFTRWVWVNRFMAHIWISCVTHMNESCHTYEWVMSHMNDTLSVSEVFLVHVTVPWHDTLHTLDGFHTHSGADALQYQMSSSSVWNMSLFRMRCVVSYSHRRRCSSVSDESLFSVKWVALEYEMRRSSVWNVSLFNMKCVTLQYEMCRLILKAAPTLCSIRWVALQYEMSRSAVWNVSSHTQERRRRFPLATSITLLGPLISLGRPSFCRNSGRYQSRRSCTSLCVWVWVCARMRMWNSVWVRVFFSRVTCTGRNKVAKTWYHNMIDMRYGVATVSRLLKFTGLFCKRDL